MDMNRITTYSVLTAGAVVAGVAVDYIKFTRERRAKRRAAIEAWAAENAACVKIISDRVTELKDRGDVSLTELLAIIREEEEFLKIVFNQPIEN